MSKTIKTAAITKAKSSTESTILTLTQTSNFTNFTFPIIIPTHISNTTNSESSAAIGMGIGIGIGVGLGGLVLIIVSSLLIAKFVFHKEIPLPIKSSRSRNSPPHETGSDVINGAYEQKEDNKLTESIESKPSCSEGVTPDPPSNSTLVYIGFQDLIQPNSGQEGLSKADYGVDTDFECL